MTARHGIDAVRTAVAGLCRAWGRAVPELPQPNPGSQTGSDGFASPLSAEKDLPEARTGQTCAVLPQEPRKAQLPQTADAAPGRSPGIGCHSGAFSVAVIAARTQLPGLRAPALFLSVAAADPCSPGAAVAGGRRAALPPSVRRPSSFQFRASGMASGGYAREQNTAMGLHVGVRSGTPAAYPLSPDRPSVNRIEGRARQPIHQPLDDGPDGLRVRLYAHRRPLPIRDARLSSCRTRRCVARKLAAPVVSSQAQRRSFRWDSASIARGYR
jgi:hypothetical protein